MSSDRYNGYDSLSLGIDNRNKKNVHTTVQLHNRKIC
jgi:hypothetical protein